MIMIIYHALGVKFLLDTKRSGDVRLTFSFYDLYMMFIFLFHDVFLRSFDTVNKKHSMFLKD